MDADKNEVWQDLEHFLQVYFYCYRNPAAHVFEKQRPPSSYFHFPFLRALSLEIIVMESGMFIPFECLRTLGTLTEQ